MTTKQEERDALKQIRLIIESLGADSYIAAAFDGCIEIAEENIENDFSISMKQMVENAERRANKAWNDRAALEHQNTKLKAKLHNLLVKRLASE